MNLQDKILKAIKEGLNTAFNFDDIADTQLEDIKTELTKNTAYSVKHRWLYLTLILFIDNVLNEKNIALTIEEQNFLFEDCINKDIYYLFTDNETFKKFIQKYCDTNTKANLNWIDTSNITDMGRVFFGSEFNGDISSWDMSNVTTMSVMFYRSKFDGDISRWNVSSVTDMNGMFTYSKYNGDISSWDVSSVTNMYGMFAGSKFNSDISKWDVSSVTDMGYMFYHSIFNGDLSSWNVSSVTITENMFSGCKIKEEHKPKF